jgi:hypothetical protein
LVNIAIDKLVEIKLNRKKKYLFFMLCQRKIIFINFFSMKNLCFFQTLIEE